MYNIEPGKDLRTPDRNGCITQDWGNAPTSMRHELARYLQGVDDALGLPNGDHWEISTDTSPDYYRFTARKMNAEVQIGMWEDNDAIISGAGKVTQQS